MIFIKYLIKEIIKSQIAILCILSFIFLCYKITKILSIASEINIPINLLFLLFILGFSEISQLILPFSLFVGILITLSRLYYYNEITVMHACGLGKNVIIQAVVILSMITMFLAIINVTWIYPLSSSYKYKIFLKIKSNPNINLISEGKFNSIGKDRSILFVENIQKNTFKNIFFAQPKYNNHSFTLLFIASKGYMNQTTYNSPKTIFLDNGICYEISNCGNFFKITYFTQYKALINPNPSIKIDTRKNNCEHMTMHQLWNSKKIEEKFELHWRLTLVFSVFIMAIMVIPMSVMNPRQGRILNALPAFILYLIFFILQTYFRFNGYKCKFNPILGIWIINILYLTIAFLLNLIDSFMIKRLYSKLCKIMIRKS